MNICKAIDCGKPSGAYVVCRYHYFMLPERMRYNIRNADALAAAVEYIRKLEKDPPQILYSCKLGAE